MRWLSAVIVALVPLAGAAVDDPKETAIKAELEKLRGKWKQVSSETRGKETATPDEWASKSIATIEVNKWTSGPIKMTFSIDPTQDPKHWDSTIKGKDGKDLVDKGIYKLDGDTLTMCSGRTPGPNELKDVERPKEFKTMGGGHIVVYKRVKE